jgi:pilus assembly protein CpaF
MMNGQQCKDDSLDNLDSERSRLVSIIGEEKDPENSQFWETVIEYMKPILSLYISKDVSEIMINRYDNILVQTSEGQKKVENKFDSEAALDRFIVQVARASGQIFNVENPILDSRFPDDSRLCCVHRSLSPRGCNVTLRIARTDGGTITPKMQIDNGYMTQEMWDYLTDSYNNGKNIIFSGNTGSGKTSMMRNLLMSCDQDERILIVEDTNEINIEHSNVINMEAAVKKNSTVTMENLIKTTLRQFPSKLVVGEIRDASAANALIQAINTGVTGCTASLHANNTRASLRRLQYLLSTLGFVTFEMAGELVLTSIDIFVQCERSSKSGRRVTEICVVNDDCSYLTTLYEFDHENKNHIKI